MSYVFGVHFAQHQSARSFPNGEVAVLGLTPIGGIRVFSVKTSHPTLVMYSWKYANRFLS
jgi:hypothetical protein